MPIHQTFEIQQRIEESESRGCDESDARACWKRVYRLQRISSREAMKATIDLITFGSGAIIVCNDGLVKHEPIQSLFEMAEPEVRKSFCIPEALLTSGSYEKSN